MPLQPVTFLWNDTQWVLGVVYFDREQGNFFRIFPIHQEHEFSFEAYSSNHLFWL